LIYKALHIELGFILLCFLCFNNTITGNNVAGVKNDLSQAKDTLIVSKIYLLGNIKTKEKIILSELRFKQNSIVTKENVPELVFKSKQNLQNTSLFNFVYIQYWCEKPDEICFEVKVEERWYTWALPLFEQADRNFSAFLENGDWSRVNYGIYLKQENFRGLNQLLKLKLRVGYVNEAELKFNTAEYNNKLSWGFNTSYYANNQISYGVIGNEAIYAKTPDVFIAQRFTNEVFLTFRHHFVNRHKLAVGYKRFSIQDTLALLNPNYLLDGNTFLNYLTLRYRYKLDQRDSKTYPLKGTYFYGSLTKSGLGIINDNINNFTFNFQLHQYGDIYNRLKYGWNLGGILNSNKNNPFVISNGLGYEEFLNGYEYNVIEGDNFAYSKQKLLFELIPTKTKNISFINLRQFSKIHYAVYVKAYFDNGFVYKTNPHITNTLSNSYLYSYGLGIDFVTYYDKVLSINYSVNKQGFSGIYFHLNLGM